MAAQLSSLEWTSICRACRNLTTIQKAVLMELAWRTRDEGNSWPSQALIADVVCCSERAVREALASLVEIGLLRCEQRYRDNGARSTNFYWMQLDQLMAWTEAHGSATGLKFVVSPPERGAGGTGTGCLSPPERGAGAETKNELSILNSPFEQEPPNPPKTKEPKAAFKPESVALPASLETDQFRSAWSDWCQYRRERRLTMTPITVKKQLAQCEAWGVAAAVESIETSIRAGWQGLFEPKQRTNGVGTNGRTQHLRPDRKGRHIRTDGYYERIAAERGWTYASATRESDAPASAGH